TVREHWRTERFLARELHLARHAASCSPWCCGNEREVCAHVVTQRGMWCQLAIRDDRRLIARRSVRRRCSVSSIQGCGVGSMVAPSRSGAAMRNLVWGGLALCAAGIVTGGVRSVAASQADDVMALERAALDRWGKGDPSGFLETYASEITYFDPATERRVD